MDITLTPDVEAALTQEAQRRGTTVEMLALDCLRERFVSPDAVEESEGAESLLDFLGEYVGAVSSSEQVAGGAQMSDDTGRRFAAGMAEKRARGHL